MDLLSNQHKGCNWMSFNCLRLSASRAQFIWLCNRHDQWRGPGAGVGGGGEIFLADQDFFRDKYPFFVANISDDLFLVIDQIFHIFRIFTMLYDPFLTRKTPFFTLFILSRASDNTTSPNIFGDGCMGRPPPQILGERPPSPPRSPHLYSNHVEQLKGNFDI